jgi:hypothetical protein
MRRHHCFSILRIAYIRIFYYTDQYKLINPYWSINMFGTSNFCKSAATETLMLIGVLSVIFAIGIAIF